MAPPSAGEIAIMFTPQQRPFSRQSWEGIMWQHTRNIDRLWRCQALFKNGSMRRLPLRDGIDLIPTWISNEPRVACIYIDRFSWRRFLTLICVRVVHRMSTRLKTNRLRSSPLQRNYSSGRIIDRRHRLATSRTNWWLLDYGKWKPWLSCESSDCVSWNWKLK
jgi:hypothetical protein